MEVESCSGLGGLSTVRPGSCQPSFILSIRNGEGGPLHFYLVRLSLARLKLYETV